MKTLQNTCFLLLTLLIGCQTDDDLSHTSNSTNNDRIVTDSLFQKEMFDYLIPRVMDQYFDSTGHRLSATNEYRQTSIVLIDLKTPTIMTDTLPIGVYKVQFACEDCGAAPELLIKDGPEYEFLNLDKGGLTDDEVMDRVQKLFVLHPDKFNDSDKVAIKRNVVRLVLKDRQSYGRNAL
jgi:glutaredoxin